MMSEKERVNILLVDDQPAKLLTYEAILKDLDENLVQANSAREAFDCLLKNDFALVLVDVCMPELDGYQLASMIRDHPRFEKTAIIFISAIYLTEFDRVRGYESGAVDYVPVPIVPEILQAKVKVFVELYRKTRELQRLNFELEDRVAQRTAELQASNKRLQESEERLRLASEAAEFGTYDFNVSSGTIYCSPQLKHLLRVDEDADLDLGKILDLVHQEDREGVRRCLLGQEGDSENRHHIEFRVPRTDGSICWLLNRGQTFHTPGPSSEPMLRIMGTVIDMTERKQTEERQTLLMAELDHRVKNILANISAIARLSSGRAVSVKQFVEALDARIQAVSRAHSMLRRDSWSGISLHDYLSELLSPFMESRGSNVTFDGDSVYLLPSVAQSLALVFHELATNAAKYGALSVPEGHVHISWLPVPAKGAGWIKLVWRESDGPPVQAPAEKGFGITVIREATYEFADDVEYRFDADGVLFALEGIIGQTNKPKRTAPQAQPRLENHAPVLDGRKYRVLVLEDEALVALRVKSDLETAGHTVVGLAKNVSQGLDLAQRENIDFALLDLCVGDDLSTPVAELLLREGIPFAFGTGYEDDIILPPHLRAVPRLTKPYASHSIAHFLDSVMSADAIPGE